MADQDLILRHSAGERVTHWAITFVFFYLFLSGLALFHPFFFWLSFLLGGGQLMRFLHPFAGALLVVLFYPYAVRLVKDNRWLPADSAWVKNMSGYMTKQHHAEDTHKYNAGQKLLYWALVVLIAVLFLTGIPIWQPWFAPSFSAGLRSGSALVHVVAAFVMFVGIGVHWYAAYWTKGSIRAMVRGTVTRAWARFHHPAWYREVAGKEGS